jgi:drug/metabolite transporter (DMT)-like permease
MCINAGFSLIVYHLIGLRSFPHTIKAVLHNKKTFVALGVAIAVVWIITYWIASAYTADTFSIVYMIVPALWGALVFYKRSRQLADLIRVTAFLCVLIALYVHSAIRLSLRDALYLVTVSIVLGIANVIYFRCSGKLLKADISSIEILAIRLWPIFLISLAACIVGNLFQELSLSVALKMPPLAVVSTLLPNYLGQKSIEHIGGKRHAVWISFIPVLTCICELLLLKEQHTFLTILSCVLVFALLVKRPA